MTHSSSEIVMCRSFWIDRSATFTTVLSSMIMKSPNETATSVHHLRCSSSRKLLRIRARTASTPFGSTRLRVAVDGRDLDTERGGSRPRERRAPDAPARAFGLLGARPALAGGARMVLGGGGRGHGNRVLAAVETRGGHL